LKNGHASPPFLLLIGRLTRGATATGGLENRLLIEIFDPSPLADRYSMMWL
jgi:hypothetical protein